MSNLGDDTGGRENEAIVAALEGAATNAEQMEEEEGENQSSSSSAGIQQQTAIRRMNNGINVVYTMPQGRTQAVQPFLAPSALSRSTIGVPLLNREAPFDAQKELNEFWPKQKRKVETIEQHVLREATRCQELPLARIKKIMKLDDDVKSQMISAETPVLFAKAAEMFIEELTLRSWIHTEDNKRRTLQKSDIAMAISKYEQFDFLIDIVPREEALGSKSIHTKHNKPPPLQEQCLVIDDRSTPTRNSQNDGISFTQGPSGETLQYFVQTPSSTMPEIQQISGSQLATPIQLQNGQVVQATAIGEPIPLQSSGSGQGFQLIQVVGDGSQPGQPIQLQILPTQQITNTTESG